MFLHNFKYALITLFKNKMLIFWTFAFPLVLATLFNMAFSNIANSETLDIIPIAIVNNEYFNSNEILTEAFKTLSDEKNSERLFDTKYVTQEEAKELLEKEEISGYILFTESPKVVVTSNGINETILNTVTKEVLQSANIIKNLANAEIQKELMAGNQHIDYEKLYQKVVELSQNSQANIQDTSSNNLDYTMIEFYTLIAMTCLYGGILSMNAVNQNLANMSHNGKRIAVSPISKGKIMFSSLLASYITQLIGILLLFIYTIFVLKIDYGTNLPLIILLTLVGSLAGMALGIIIATLIKSNDNTKTGILISITMLCCFLSGMMGVTMKYVVDKNFPILNMINPANMITDGFYSLYYYDTLDRYYINIISLAIFAFILIGISIFQLRRQKYDSI